MTRLLLRSLAHYWRTNAAVVLGVAAAVAVLAGALVVGESVRESLRRIALRQLGRTDEVVKGGRFFGEPLAAALAGERTTAAPLVAVTGVVTHQASGRRAGEVAVYGVDERFWAFHGVDPNAVLEDRDALVGAALAAELQSVVGDTLLVRLPPASEIPGSSLFGRRDVPGRSLRVSVRGTLAPEALGEFSLRPRQRPVSALFVPLKLLRKSMGVESGVNAILLGGAPARPIAEAATLEDMGLRVRPLPAEDGLSLDSTSAVLSDDVVQAGREAAASLGFETTEVLIYLANEMRTGGRAIPYSLVAALDKEALERLTGQTAQERSIFLNAWAAEDLGARPGDAIDLEYYLWEEEGRLATRKASFTYAGTVPMEGLGAEKHLVPDYPGITESAHISDWDPPFPVDLSKIRPRDESYWERYRAAPKAFVPLAAGQELWGHRRGRVTSLRLRLRPEANLDEERRKLEAVLRARLDPARDAAIVLEPVRAEALQAARGSTDFGEYFVYFSFFLVAAALLLAGLFFRLGVEQRLREIGLLRSVGFSRRDVRRLFLAEGAVLSVAGGLVGIAGACAYADLVVRGLRTLWVGAVGTRDIALHVSAPPLAAGFAGGVVMAALAIALTLRGLRRRSPRSLLSGAVEVRSPTGSRTSFRAALVPAAIALVLLAASGLGRLPAAAAFFGAGGLLLVAALVATTAFLRRRRHRPVHRLVGLGIRGASFRPGRSVLCVALIAAAAFVIVSVGSFRREEVDTTDRHGESGGYALLAQSLLPLHSDLAALQGQQSLNLPPGALDGVSVARFRMRKGDDASCLNLYRPGDPTVLAPARDFVEAGRFAFQSSLATTPEEKANPWRLLDGERRNDAIPAIADASSLEYVLHRKLGEEMDVGGSRVVFVGALRPGLFQGELLVGERHFSTAFPDEEGYRFFLLDVPPARERALTEALESRLSDFGMDVSSAAARLAEYHRVENTYISTFQALGALGLVLGTVGLGAVLLRNAFERRRELALLQAVGYRRRHISQMVLAENLLLLVLGLTIGTATALLAVLPVLRARPGVVPIAALGALLLTVLVVGVAASRIGIVILRRLPLLASLRSE
jgi:putative ABC transport system permease protein